MILCVNANAAIDKTIIISPFRLNEIHRPQQVLATPGGKGCNVARGLKRLGETPVVSGWVGGFAGQFIQEGLRREGIWSDFVHTDFESRVCLSIVDPENNTLTEIYEKGYPIPIEKVEEFKRLLQRIIQSYAVVTLSGSLPPGVPEDFYAQVLEIAHSAGVAAILDGSGEALKLGASGKPLLIKSNRQEFSDLLGSEPKDHSDIAGAAIELSNFYQAMIVVSLGSEGAIGANRDEVLHVCPPAVEVKSAVGSGDCMLAGMTYGLTHSLSFADTIKCGVAAGTANALEFGAGVFSRNEFDHLLAGVTVRKVSPANSD
jgi:1-phosphofructokinase family hexose kinase